ncbi:hypothetical protein [Streptosporangium sp. NPDC048865]|uniref:hypothetical protein n=1 Tax=Streptosporangium sp. NPDC048865 TaxID=3155766 RepID=UPI003436F279
MSDGRLVRHLPLWVRRQPTDAFLTLLGLSSGIALLVGPATSRALETVLPAWGRLLWGLCQVLGCAAWLAGLISIREQEDGQLIITRLPMLILGLQLLAPAALVYGVSIILLSGWAGVLAAWLPLAAAAMTYLRRLDLVRQERDRRDRL